METMKTDPSKKPPPAKKPSPLDELGEGIPVSRLDFHRPNGVDIPGRHGAGGIRAGKNDAGTYEIAYLPRIRHHRVVYTPRNTEKAQQTFYVPETWCTWEVAE